jgi:hypothetical protein
LHSELRARIDALQEQIKPPQEPIGETPEAKAARKRFQAMLDDPDKWRAEQERERQRFAALPWKKRHQIVEARLARALEKLAIPSRLSPGEESSARFEVAIARFELCSLEEDADAKRRA